MEIKECKEDGLNAYASHFSEKYSQNIINYANDLFPDYIFTKKEKSQQYGYCTACKKEFKTEGLKHKEKVRCPKCNENVTVQSSGMGRTKMINQAYFVYYEKSQSDSEAIVARGIYAIEDYSKSNYKTVKPIMEDRTLYIFKIGESVMLKRYLYFYNSELRMGTPYFGSYGDFEKTKSIHSELGSWLIKTHGRGVAAYSRESIAEAVVGTPFQYSTWENYYDEPMVKFFELFAKYPYAVENLTKLGFERIIDAKLTGNNTCGSVNWRGKTVFDILRLNRMELKVLRASRYSIRTSIEPLYLRLFQINKKDKNGLTIYELSELESELGTNQIKDITFFTKYTTLKKMYIYIKKQENTCKSEDGKKQYFGFHTAMRDYKDYIADCETLGMDLKKEQVLFPKNLYIAHQNTLAQIKVKENEKFNKKIRKRAKVLNEKYYFEYAGLMIRAACDSKELIEEGKTLSHCVGTYAKRYADGNTNIFLIRKISEQDKPYFTMEIDNKNQIIQTRGLRNCNPDADVKKLIEVFKAEKLTEKKKRTTKISA